MPTFGFSAYLKLVSLNEKPQRTEVRGRFKNRENGYDFHRSLRLRARRLLVDNEPIDAVMASINEILRVPEQKSARLGLDYLVQWRLANPGSMVAFEPALYESPEKIFKINFAPDFGIRIGTDSVAVHIWNTATPPLKSRLVYAALSLFPEIYDQHANAPKDIALLSLRDGKLYRLSDGFGHAALGARLVEQVEAVFRRVRNELGLPPSSRDDRPSAPPPPAGS